MIRPWSSAPCDAGAIRAESHSERSVSIEVEDVIAEPGAFTGVMVELLQERMRSLMPWRSSCLISGFHSPAMPGNHANFPLKSPPRYGAKASVRTGQAVSPSRRQSPCRTALGSVCACMGVDDASNCEFAPPEPVGFPVWLRMQRLVDGRAEKTGRDST